MIPFKQETQWDFAAERRLKHTVAFIDPADIEGKWVGNIGGQDRMFEEVLRAFGHEHAASTGLLGREDWNDRGDWSGLEDCDTILCLEILEHVMNPARFLNGLVAQGMTLYLSTPVRNPIGMWSNRAGHFTEYDTDKVGILLDYCGWRVTKHATFRTYPFSLESYRHMGLIRGTIRIATQRTQLWRAVAK